MAEPRFDDEALRRRLLAALAELPDDEHLDALHAIDHGDYDLVLTDPAYVVVEVTDRLTVTIPLRELLVSD